MVRNTIDVKDDSSGKKRSRAGTRKPGLPTPPVTLPVPRLREMPEVDERGWKRQPAELDPLLLAPEAEESVPAREKAAAPGGQNGSGAPRAAAPGASASGTAQSADLDFHMPAEDEELRLRLPSSSACAEKRRDTTAAMTSGSASSMSRSPRASPFAMTAQPTRSISSTARATRIWGAWRCATRWGRPPA